MAGAGYCGKLEFREAGNTQAQSEAEDVVVVRAVRRRGVETADQDQEDEPAVSRQFPRIALHQLVGQDARKKAWRPKREVAGGRIVLNGQANRQNEEVHRESAIPGTGDDEEQGEEKIHLHFVGQRPRRPQQSDAIRKVLR